MQFPTGSAGPPEASVAVAAVTTAQQLLTDALTLMLVGVGTVFVFLTLLVWVTSLMSLAVNRIVPAASVSAPEPAPDDAAVAATHDHTLLAVITAAIHAHRTRR